MAGCSSSNRSHQPWSTSLRKADAWIHEVQFDGFRTQAIKDEDGIRFYTRRGHDWTAKYRRFIALVRPMKSCQLAVARSRQRQNMDA
ncbi:MULTISPECIES: hypothetical protein [unclassified Mesorhizobium]|uniref:ATP-dependent DNA ligase n=1 Tax=unclassified Mesorhizobium TaxID=325217 RepID=UPI0026DA05C9